jgi:NADPH:quinone reductase-like Zn-dependent oxidoreductase
MKAVVVSKAGAPFEITHDLERPAPGARQILVKNCYTAINPV